MARLFTCHNCSQLHKHPVFMDPEICAGSFFCSRTYSGPQKVVRRFQRCNVASVIDISPHGPVALRVTTAVTQYVQASVMSDYPRALVDASAQCLVLKTSV